MIHCEQTEKENFLLTKLASDAAYAEQYLDEWEVGLKGYVGTENSKTSRGCSFCLVFQLKTQNFGFAAEGLN